jgi:hypothetical protein
MGTSRLGQRWLAKIITPSSEKDCR